MNTKTQQVLEKIREVCPELMELSLGCQISNPKQYPLVYVGYSNAQHCLSLTMNGKQSLLFVDGIKNTEIIGHPAHLEHLLRALGRQWSVDGCGYIVHGLDAVAGKYDLTLSVEQNLEQNEELRDFIYELICDHYEKL